MSSLTWVLLTIAGLAGLILAGLGVLFIIFFWNYKRWGS